MGEVVRDAVGVLAREAEMLEGRGKVTVAIVQGQFNKGPCTACSLQGKGLRKKRNKRGRSLI